MLKFFLNLARFRSIAAKPADLGLQWQRDPLSHPALQGMDQRELGDLPFRR